MISYRTTPNRCLRKGGTALLSLVLLLIGTALTSPLHAAPSLQHTIDSLLADTVWQTAQVGIYIHDVSTDTPLYAFNARQRMRPASTEKLVTAIAALDNLGPNHALATRLYADGPVEGTTLHGNVWVWGGMDPMTTAPDVQSLIGSLRTLGIDSIDGGMRFDLSMKDTLRYGWGWCWDDDNHILTPLLCDRKPLAAALVTAALRQAGVRIREPLGTKGEAAPLGRRPTGSRTTVAQAPALPLRAQTAHTLADVLQRMMKESDNLYAECVFYQLAARTGRPWADRKQALALIQNTMKRAGIGAESYNVADGSGLSLYNYQTPASLVSLLAYAARNNIIYQTLSQALPVAGVDGTLNNRMKGTPAQGNVRAKTGTVTGVTSLAGYATRPDGHLIAFAIIVNGLQKGAPGRTLQDNICVAILQDPASER